MFSGLDAGFKGRRINALTYACSFSWRHSVLCRSCVGIPAGVQAIAQDFQPSLFGLKITSVKRLRMPFSEPRTLQLVGSINFERFQNDYQRCGFFRIGLLPILVADQVALEFCHIRGNRAFDQGQ